MREINKQECEHVAGGIIPWRPPITFYWGLQLASKLFGK